MEGRVRAETGRSSRAEEAGAGDVAHAEHVAWQGVEEAGVTEGLSARGRGRSRVGTSEGRVEMRLKHCVLGGGQPRCEGKISESRSSPYRVPGKVEFE